MFSIKLKEIFKKYYIPIGIPAGIVIGIFIGYFFPEIGKSIKLSGLIFMKLLKMIIIPLVFLSVVNGIGKIGNIQYLGKKGLATVIYFLTTTSIAVFIGMVFTIYLSFGNIKPEIKSTLNKEITMNIQDIFLSMIPQNIFDSMAKNEVLPIIAFSIMFGIALIVQGKRSEIVFKIFFILEDAIIKIVHFILWIAPIGIMGLIASRVAETGEQFFIELQTLQYYVRNVLIGLFIHGFIILPILYLIFTKKNPLKYLQHLLPALGTAFSTASSSATLSVTMDCVENNAKVRTETASFVLPLGATLNMDGTALYEGIAAMFIAYTYSIPLDLYSMILIFLTSNLAAIGAAGIPEAGLVTMAIVLNAVGLPLEGITLILTVDWFLDRCRTTINVWGDAVGSAIIDKVT